MADLTAKAAEQVRALRNKALRGVQERDTTGTTTPLNRMTPAELTKFRDDLIYLTTQVDLALDERQRQVVRVGDEEKPGSVPRNNNGGRCTGTVNECRVCEGVDCPTRDPEVSDTGS